MAFGETAGYHSAEAADKALAEARKDTEKCTGVVNSALGARPLCWAPSPPPASDYSRARRRTAIRGT